MRVPAEVESGVNERIGRFLADVGALFETVQPLEPDVVRLQPLMRWAEGIAGTLGSIARSDLRRDAAENCVSYRGPTGSDQYYRPAARIASSAA